MLSAPRAVIWCAIASSTYPYMFTV